MLSQTEPHPGRKKSHLRRMKVYPPRGKPSPFQKKVRVRCDLAWGRDAGPHAAPRTLRRGGRSVFSTSRRYTVTEPLPAAGMAEVWTFEVQYQYQNAPFGQVSQPLELTVRG